MTMNNPYTTELAPEPKKKSGKLKWVAAGGAVLVALGIATSQGGDGGSSAAGTSSPVTVTATVKAAAPTTASPAAAATPAQGLEKVAAAVAPATPAAAAKTTDSVPREYKNALRKAESYSKTMHMSKLGIYDQLTSTYGEGFSPDAAQYAVDNLNADYNANALEKAKSYQDMMAMSPDAIYDQLVSDYGEQFTASEAQYAVDNLPQ